MGGPDDKALTAFSLALKAAAAGAMLVALFASAGLALAQQGRAARSPQDVLRAAKEIARSEDLTNVDFLGGRLGLRFVAQPEQDYTGWEGEVGKLVRMRLQRHDDMVFAPHSGPVYYEIYLPSRGSYKRADFSIRLASEKMCITMDDFVAVFGSGARRTEATDGGGFGYVYGSRQDNQVSVSGSFGHRKCMQNLRMEQNMFRVGG